MVRRGFTLVEVLFSLLLLLVTVQAGWALFVGQQKASLQVARSSEGLETVRTLAWLLDRELSGGRAGKDWGDVSVDSVAVRAFRGVGLMVPAGADSARFRVCYRGLRNPNPAKDSVLVLNAVGRWEPVALRDRRWISSSCSEVEGGHLESWVLFPPPSSGVLGRVFEKGSYHLADSAFRYRRGRSGRQPLTPTRVLEGALRLLPGSDPILRWNLVLTGPEPGSEAGVWRGGAGR